MADPELCRLRQLIAYEMAARAQGFRCIAGIDEAGRGPLAGPVFAAACIIPEKIRFRGIDDSKKLSAPMREALFVQITSHKDVVFAIGSASPEDIDRINIYQATIQAMLQAVSKLPIVPDYLLVDGLQLPHASIPVQKIIKGDTLSQSIAAASILAKVSRDRLMLAYDQQWPMYGFKQHKGYGTPQHMQALAQHGPCPIHRKSFAGTAAK